MADYRPHPLRDAGLGISLMTILPTPARWPDGESTDSAGWYPLAGLMLGGLTFAVVTAARALGWHGNAAMVVASLVVVMGAAATRLLHWDGIADVTDGLWGGHTPERRLEIMKDSHVGAFGSAAIALVALVEVSSVASLLATKADLVLLVAPSVARYAATFAAWFGRPARLNGLGRSVMGPVRSASVVPALLVAVVLGVVSGSAGPAGLIWLGGGLVVSAAVPHLLSKPFGGVTGDIMGASVLICEAVLLSGAALIWGA